VADGLAETEILEEIASAGLGHENPHPNNFSPAPDL
jgi:hypothetical protein